jgi:hypothetical protein
MSTLKTTNLQNASAASPAFVLAADGSATANLSSVNGGPIAGTRNRIINGDMLIDQRNAGASAALSNSTIFGVDRWAIRTGTGTSNTAQRSTTAPAGFSHSTVITVGTGASPGTTSTNYFAQAIEGFNVSDLAWGSASAKSLTLSFWVRSSLTGSFGVLINSQPSNRTYPALYTISAANTWEYKTVAIPGDTVSATAIDNSQGLGVTFSLGAGSNYLGTPSAWGTGDIRGVSGETQVVATSGATFYITGVQLEPGSTATPFERRSYGQELALCQRYCVKLNDSSQTYGIIATGAAIQATDFYVTLPFTLRASPTITYANLQLSTGTGKTVSAISASANSNGTVTLLVTSSALTSGQAGILQQNNSTSGHLQLSSEL